MASFTGVLYVGFNHDLKKRVWEHKQDLVEGFTKRYRCHTLVYFESGEGKEGVLFREKQIKKWRRQKKIDLIKTINPNMTDLYQII